ncbi:hypothetical protein [Streptomyces alfalfae]|uniref:hypothetical protein n=1 Tax=Streptomyces alfalfae TaxID=1642299 RepID=UPI0028125D10|nr:hypothetical protein [Streptomyces alfalfae]
MRRDEVEDWRDQVVIDGTAEGTTYAAGTIEAIDASLAMLAGEPGHPDVDRLLDARLLLAGH